MLGYHNGKMSGSQTHNPHSVWCPFQEQKAPHPHSLIHSNHAWWGQAWYFRDKKQPGHQTATSVTEKAGRHNRSTHTSAAPEEAQGTGEAPRGHFARLAPCWAKAWAESQQETGLSRKQHQEPIRRGSSSDCRKTGGHEPVWLISGTVKSLDQATQHPLYIHLRLLPWEALILTWFPTSTNKGLHANQNRTGSYEMKNL